jgi:O-antigen/teichoic acid export membrane protein
MSILRRFAGNSLLYALAFLFNRGVSFLLLPLYTRHLTPADYGILAFCGSFSSVLALVLAFGLSGAVNLSYFKLPAAEHPNLLKTVWVWYAAVPLAAGILLELAGPWLAAELVPEVPWHPYLRLAAWVGCCTIALELPVTLCFVEQRAGRYALLTTAAFLLTVGLLVWLVVLRGGGALGSLWAQLLAGLACTAASYWVVWRYCRPLRWPLVHWRHLAWSLQLCLPVLPYTLFLWALNVSDRWILGRHVALADVGVYCLAYTLGMSITLCGAALGLAYAPLYYRSAEDPAFRPQLRKLLGVYLAVVTWATLAVALLAPEVVGLMTHDAYTGAADLVPWIAAGYWAYAGFYLLSVYVIQRRERMGWLTLIAGLPAGANILLNLVLVPRYGVFAAALTTLLCLMLMAVLALGISRRMDRLPYPWLTLAQFGAVALGVYWLGVRWVSGSDLWRAVLFKAVLLTVAGLGMVWLLRGRSAAPAEELSPAPRAQSGAATGEELCAALVPRTGEGQN